MRFVDSHLHLDSPDAEAIVRYAEASGGLLIACGVDEPTSVAVLAAAHGHPGSVFPFVGVHPSEVGKAPGLGWMQGALDKATGVGEVGLDPAYSPAGAGSPQAKSFQGQLEAAQERGLPVVVHSRGAEKQVLDTLATFRLKAVLMHWLESEEQLPSVVGRGYFASFGPAILYSKKLQRIASKADPALALAESDSPVAYAPLGGVHGPSLVPSVAFKLAELWRRPFEDVLHLTSDNAERFLGTRSKG